MKRLFLVVTVVAFLGWLSWLAFAVSKAGTVPIVSRAQLTAATHLVVVDLTLDGDLPKTKATVLEVISGEGVKPGDEIDVGNLPSALVPGGKAITQPGPFLVPVVRTGEKFFRVASLPKSPGYDAPMPADYRPLIYPWGEDVKVQLRSLGLLK